MKDLEKAVEQSEELLKKVIREMDEFRAERELSEKIEVTLPVAHNDTAFQTFMVSYWKNYSLTVKIKNKSSLNTEVHSFTLKGIESVYHKLQQFNDEDFQFIDYFKVETNKWFFFYEKDAWVESNNIDEFDTLCEVFEPFIEEFRYKALFYKTDNGVNKEGGIMAFDDPYYLHEDCLRRENGVIVSFFDNYLFEHCEIEEGLYGYKFGDPLEISEELYGEKNIEALFDIVNQHPFLIKHLPLDWLIYFDISDFKFTNYDIDFLDYIELLENMPKIAEDFSVDLIVYGKKPTLYKSRHSSYKVNEREVYKLLFENSSFRELLETKAFGYLEFLVKKYNKGGEFCTTSSVLELPEFGSVIRVLDKIYNGFASIVYSNEMNINQLFAAAQFAKVNFDSYSKLSQKDKDFILINIKI
ncbi:hypothetical protein CFI10_11585 [Marinobacterium iners]|uniref:hypothetical protein n=1 Tax=Marinobacterium iners TaxID=48076 RepID=UPI001A90A685|nr:hypothetical protein [Marinobacterium iners]QSR35631.1 hypothetical protein CFI10_11585 [Marinobacterium iners]